MHTMTENTKVLITLSVGVALATCFYVLLKMHSEQDETFTIQRVCTSVDPDLGVVRVASANTNESTTSINADCEAMEILAKRIRDTKQERERQFCATHPDSTLSWVEYQICHPSAE